MRQNEPRKNLDINPPVFLISAAAILGISLFGVSAPKTAAGLFQWVQNEIVQRFGWFYVLVVAVFIVFMIGLALSRYGNIKLGPDDCEPDYSYTSWFAMLFSAGMGIGLVFYGVAEPILHYVNPPTGPGQTLDAARQAMVITFFHWGIHAWAIYAVLGLSIAFFSFRHKLPLTIRSSLYPILGERIHGPIGHAVDIFAVLGTMFGVATSLGIGVMQVNAGLNYLFGLPTSLTMQVVLIAVITLMATASVVSGLDVGIRRLSELNLGLAIIFVLFVLIAGPTLFLLNALVQNAGQYMSEIVGMTFHLFAYKPNDWIGGWTLFYWGWWISWSPFVGMFIARVSRGRTVREFIIGVLLVPTFFTFVWMTVFGNTAIHLDMTAGGAIIGQEAQDNAPVALFAMLQQLPWSTFSAGIGTLMVVTFFVTSSDSASLVIDMIASGGHQNPPIWQRVFWAMTEGFVAAALLIAGGSSALQTGAIATALPFAVVMLFICYGLWKGLRMEGGRRMIREFTPPPTVPITGTLASWETRLKNALRHRGKSDVTRFLAETVAPALQTVKTELEKQGLTVRVDRGTEEVSLKVLYDGATDFHYDVKLVDYMVPQFAFPEMPSTGDEHHHYRADVFLLEGPQHYNIMGNTKEQVIADVVSQFEKHMHFLHLDPVGAG